MNKTAIEWCSMTWNPVTGCKHGCEYCYAARMSKRFGWSFEPEIHRNRLGQPQIKKQPQNIFVCSMADLFGSWVPDEWINTVFETCENAPWHRYLFLTKNPNRYKELLQKKEVPRNFWFGSTVTNKDEMFLQSCLHNTFLSIEPIQSDFTRDRNGFFVNWVIIGAETGNRKAKVIPKREWIESIVKHCRGMSVPVFMKNSLRKVWGDPLIQEYPWEKG